MSRNDDGSKDSGDEKTFVLPKPDSSMIFPAVAVIAGVIVVLRILIVSRLNVNTALTLLNEGGTVNAIVGSFLGQPYQVVLYILGFSYLWYGYALYEPHYSYGPAIACLICTLLAVLLLPAPFALVALFQLLLIGRLELKHRYYRRAERENQLVFSFINLISEEFKKNERKSEGNVRFEKMLEKLSWVRLSLAEELENPDLNEEVARLGRAFIESADSLEKAEAAAQESQQDIVSSVRQHQMEFQSRFEELRQWVTPHEHRVPPETRVLFVRLLIGSIVIFSLLSLVYLPYWKPLETIKLRDGQEVIGYVVSTDGEWTSIMSYGSRRIRRVPADEVVERHNCILSSGSDYARITVELGLEGRPGQFGQCSDD